LSLPLQFTLISLAIAAGVAIARFSGRRAEGRGQPVSRPRKRGASGGTAFLGLQRIVDPPARHVIQLDDRSEKRIEADDSTTDDGRAPPRWDFTQK
jgi:hypothetical protein